jgi:Putative peptidoglycan binding domain
LESKTEKAGSGLFEELLSMKGLVVFRWLMPVAVAALLSVPMQTANAGGKGGGGGHSGRSGGHAGGGGGHTGGRVRMGGIGGARGHAGVTSHFISRTGAGRVGSHQNLAVRNHNFHGSAGRTNRFADRGRFGNQRFGREDRFGGREGRFGREGERREREFFFRHNFFVGFNFGAFGWWPWWGGPWWWAWDGWGYPYDDYGYSPYYGDPQGYASQDNDPQDNGSQYDAEYWNSLAMSVQTKLADQGYYHGQVDGVIGSGTIDAVRKFQADHGLPTTGKIDPKLLNALGIDYKAQS